MGLFSKIKNMFKSYKDEEEEVIEEKVEETPQVDIEETEPEEEVVEETTEPEEVEEETTEPEVFEEETEPEEEVVEETTELVTEPVTEPVKKEKKGLFSKKKNKEDEIKKSIKVYEKGLSKSRGGFVSRLANLTNKYSKITDDYFDELEEILIMADIGINTVMDFMDRLRDRVKKENIQIPLF